MAPPPARGGLLVVGTGLIGTSVAMAAAEAGYDVLLEDVDAQRVQLALSLLAGRAKPWRHQPVPLGVVATPPSAVATVCHELHQADVCATVTHVSSVQSNPQSEVEKLAGLWAGFVGSHPVAGRELSGPRYASPALFQERPWVICPTPRSSEAAIAAVTTLALDCGATPAVMTAAQHDELLARLSHVPQLAASALAASLVGMDPGSVSLAGSGLRDTSRLADSDPELWVQILTANAGAVAPALRPVVDRLNGVLRLLETGDARAVGVAVEELLLAGREGRQLLGGKHGQRPVRWAAVVVIVPDEPGALARLLSDAAAAGVNVEDISVEHATGHPVGVVELAVAPSGRDTLHRELGRRGWTATSSPPRAD